MKIGFIGIGKMAGAIITGLKASNFDIIISDRTVASSQDKAEALGVAYAKDHQDLIQQADLVVIGIKPQMLENLFGELAINKPILSMCAGVSLDKLASLTNSNLPIIRIMPNLNAQILKSTTAICRNKQVSDQLFEIAQSITNAFGTTFILPEKDFDAFTALAGSSPAYMLALLEAFAMAGVKHGFTKQDAIAMVTQTMAATAENLLLSDDTPTSMIDKIASPGGTTIAGLVDLEKTGFAASAISAIEATIEKSKNF
ncbi:pyrroline-5-carboxylate reductase [Streptococcus caprae]|uniref:Pyrroline-5-carboxylate reductase n=1 Tax=Streptococcus caprae TaxID=1640501 RepID=A0ABV8CW44_9STRE